MVSFSINSGLLIAHCPSFKGSICWFEPDVRPRLSPEPPRSPPPPWPAPHPSLWPRTVSLPGGKSRSSHNESARLVHRFVSISQEDQVITLAEVNSSLTVAMKKDWCTITDHRHVESPSQEWRAGPWLCLVDVAPAHRRLGLEEQQCNGPFDQRWTVLSIDFKENESQTQLN